MVLLVASVLAIGVALFFTPASGEPVQVKTDSPAAVR